MSENLSINDHMDHQRWLLEHGFINDLHKDNLYMYGAIAHKDIQALELDIDTSKKLITYRLYCSTSLLGKIEKYKQLSKSKSIFGLWKFKRLLKKEGNLNITFLLGKFVKDYCGPKWRVAVDLENYKDYKDGYEEKETTESGEVDKQPSPE